MSPGVGASARLRRVVACALAAIVSALQAPGSARAEPPRIRSGAAVDCSATKSPHPIYEFEFGHASPDSPDPVNDARRDAETRFAKKWCIKGVDCTPIRATLKPDGVGRDGSGTCFRVAALREELQRARQGVSSIAPLLRGLRASAERLAALLRERGVSKPRVLLSELRDLGAYYGDRVELFRVWIEAALTETPGLTVLARRYDKAGRLTKAGAHALVRAVIAERSEGGIPMVEVHLEADLVGTSESSILPSAACARAATVESGATPPIPVAGARQAALEDPALTLELDVGDDGWVCEGDHTQLVFGSDRPRHVRLFDLFGQDGLVLFPNAHHRDDRVHGPTPLAEGGIQFIMSPGTDYERYILIAADTPEDLGPWARFTSYCRLRPEHVQALIDTPLDGFGKAKVRDVSFRVAREGCPNTLTDADRLRVLASLPELCPP